MALSKREKMIGLVAGAAVGILGMNYYVVEPYVQARENATRDLTAANKSEHDAQLTLRREVKAKRAWKVMTTSGLMTDPSSAGQQMANRMQEWAQQSGVETQSQKVDQVTRNDQVQIVKLRWTGTASMANAARLMWRIETAEIPIKIDEAQLGARKEGTDDLTINLTVSTIWQAPERAAPGARPGGGGGGAATPAGSGGTGAGAT